MRLHLCCLIFLFYCSNLIGQNANPPEPINNIYFTYKTVHLPTHKHLKIFKETTILKFFQDNWSILAGIKNHEFIGTEKDTIPESRFYDSRTRGLYYLMGTNVYPIDYHGLGEKIPPSPNTIDELLSTLRKVLHHNYIEGDEQHIFISTEDDESEMEWHIFTERYRQEHEAELIQWFSPIASTLVEESSKSTASKGTTYLFRQDGRSDKLIVRIDGIRLEQLPEFMSAKVEKKTHFIKNNDDISTNLDESEAQFFIHLLSKIFKNSATKTNAEFIETYCKLCPHSMPVAMPKRKKEKWSDYQELKDSIYLSYPIEELVESVKGQYCGGNLLTTSSHIIEFYTNKSEFHDYYLFFDDRWMEQNALLAKDLFKDADLYEIK